ncbi:uncharacterized protein C2845_PM03G02830 [Panicum miliaceum]|uniref:Uncharacterized protein n=1 Tax=Panicum miliaceum TaxID=4540 RepID=A0A3L6TDQ8_PANMI|nr:uncharacterized protein C2845_PM03G02830 [Panicum miliaceum]
MRNGHSLQPPTGTAKTLQNKGWIDYTRGVSREQRAINRRNKLESLLSRGGDGSKRLGGRKTRLSRFEEIVRKCDSFNFDEVSGSSFCGEECCVAVENLEKNRCAIEEERFGEVLYDGEVPTFVEESFGDRVGPGEVLYRTSDNVRDLSSIVVSLALFDGFIVSSILVCLLKLVSFYPYRLQCAFLIKKTTDGFLGLYDDDIAIVTCLGLLDVYPIDLKFKATPATSASPDDIVLAAGRAYTVPSLMVMRGSPCRVCVNTWIREHQHMNKAVLGGPLLQKNDAGFLGMIYEFYDHGDTIVRYCFLPLELLRERLEHFGILNPKQLDFREYKLPEGVSSIAPSGFMKTINRIKACGYPMPPPLVLEFNGQLVNRFEERFGELLPWKGYPYGDQTSFSSERVWDLLPKKFVKNISRCVVSLASFKGLLIKWHGSKATRTVILTSASLVRDHDNEDVIDKTLMVGAPIIYLGLLGYMIRWISEFTLSLQIEVFLPPNQRGSGTLEFYNLSYNIAIVSVKKNFNAVHTEDIFRKPAQKPSEKVVAIGRDVRYGPLMATIGEVKRTNKGSNVVCKGIWVSTCKIKKAGIGGPLINFDGGFVGMNFYDGTGVTPLLPKHKIVQVLRGVINSPLPSESEYDNPEPVDVGGEAKENSFYFEPGIRSFTAIKNARLAFATVGVGGFSPESIRIHRHRHGQAAGGGGTDERRVSGAGKGADRREGMATSQRGGRAETGRLQIRGPPELARQRAWMVEVSGAVPAVGHDRTTPWTSGTWHARWRPGRAARMVTGKEPAGAVPNGPECEWRGGRLGRTRPVKAVWAEAANWAGEFGTVYARVITGPAPFCMGTSG